MKRFTHLLFAFLLTTLSFSVVACDGSDATEPDEDQDIIEVTEEGYTNIIGAGLSAALAALPMEPLSEAEIAGILYMREEEKLARDVYLVLFDQWGLTVFDNISSSEQTHMDAVYALIERYDLEDPVTDGSVGAFTNATLKELYDTLVEQGAASVVEALRVGAAIEEIDILDLMRELEENVDNADVTLVYENLMKGSRNHLRAFVRNLSAQGVGYEPQYLSEEDYLAIINSAIERGRR
ncbi:DUF2202 domain-containing protein [Rhodocaloribacter sp.]